MRSLSVVGEAIKVGKVHKKTTGVSPRWLSQLMTGVKPELIVEVAVNIGDASGRAVLNLLISRQQFSRQLFSSNRSLLPG